MDRERSTGCPEGLRTRVSDRRLEGRIQRRVARWKTTNKGALTWLSILRLFTFFHRRIVKKTMWRVPELTYIVCINVLDINYELTRPRCSLQSRSLRKNHGINNINDIKRFSFLRIDDDHDRNFHSSPKNWLNRIYRFRFRISRYL